jgi:hypothetical protein
MDIPTILSSKYPGSLWTLDGDDYTGLHWLSDTPKPTEKALQKVWPEVQAEIVAEAQARVDAKASAIAKLEALGLTVDEVQVAFGLKA